ncbi:Maf family protein [Sphingomonas montanisoli]|uniref:dTTP/UTP pyrophosphatase n=1 Tax=Sphingomonas montanisoli TaxID=2606412 RepID=A0A5D9C412_9SPHN|nr:nucleoside triphosphate pyrophosphatase [Sphingomonas montanisoli]TZG26012.1 septum formation protein Maf [Sphingomonas montanisoli]
MADVVARPRLILASSSPRRRELIGRLGIEADAIDPADIDETERKGELPLAYVKRIAAEKAAIVAARHPGAVVLGADTVVAAGRRLLHKTDEEAEARTFLKLLGGRRHRCHSAVTVIDAAGAARHRVSSSIIAFKPLSDAEIDAYLARGEWQGKAGAYAIQGYAESWVRMLSGSYSGVMGLPLFETRALLIAAGVPTDGNA